MVLIGGISQQMTTSLCLPHVLSMINNFACGKRKMRSKSTNTNECVWDTTTRTDCRAYAVKFTGSAKPFKLTAFQLEVVSVNDPADDVHMI